MCHFKETWANERLLHAQKESPMTHDGKRPLILFVCCGNRERSVIAENLFKKMLKKGYPDLAERVDAASAGIFPRSYIEHAEKNGVIFKEPFFSKKANTYAVDYLLKKGIDVSSYRSRRIDAGLVTDALLILAVDRVIRDEILFFYPEAKGRVHTFREFVFGPEGDLDIGDPLKLPVVDQDTGAWIWPEEYPLRYIREIEESLERGMVKIVAYIMSEGMD